MLKNTRTILFILLVISACAWLISMYAVVRDKNSRIVEIPSARLFVSMRSSDVGIDDGRKKYFADCRHLHHFCEEIRTWKKTTLVSANDIRLAVSGSHTEIISAEVTIFQKNINQKSHFILRNDIPEIKIVEYLEEKPFRIMSWNLKIFFVLLLFWLPVEYGYRRKREK